MSALHRERDAKTTGEERWQATRPTRPRTASTSRRAFAPRSRRASRWSWATCLDYSEEPPALFLVDRWNLYPLGVSVAEYLEALVTCLGLQGWRAELRGTSEAASFRERAAAIFTADALGASIFGRLPRRAPDSERW